MITRSAVCAVSFLALGLSACSQETAAPVEEAAVTESEATAVASFAYACEGGETASVQYPSRDVAEVTWRGETHVMRVARSASGARYTGDGLEWWTAVRGDQDTATLSRAPDAEPGGEVLARCSRPASSVLPPPVETVPAEKTADAATASELADCRNADLTLASAGEDAGAGHRAITLSLANGGERPCRVQGWPHVRVLDGAGGALARVRVVERTGAYLREDQTPANVVLAPGAHAWFDVAWSAVPHENLGETECPSAARIEVSVREGGSALRLDQAFQPCGGQVVTTPLRARQDGAGE